MRVQPVESGAALADADVNPVAPVAAAEPAATCRAPAAPPASDLARQFRRDEPGSFEQIIEAFEARLTRLAYRLLGWRSADVEDIVQDVFVAVLNHRSRFRGDASLATWLTAIMVNRCRSAHRRMRLRSLLFRSSDSAPETADTTPAWGPSVANETSKRVREAVQALPPRDREVIVLRYFEQLSPAEIAVVTRQSTNAVEVRLHRARARLATSLGLWHREHQ